MNTTIQLLVIDDDAVDRQSLKRALQASGFTCELTECNDLTRAMEIAVSKSFDCIFLDYLLPGDNGLQLLQKIRDNGVNTPVVITTSQGSESIAVELMKAGASDYIIKHQISGPVIGQILRNMLRMNLMAKEKDATVKALKISEARLAEAQRIAKIGNWELDAINSTVYWSPEVYTIFGLKAEEFSPTIDGAIDRIHVEDRDRMRSVLDFALQGNPFDIDIRIITASGIKYVHVQGYAVVNRDHLLEKIFGTIQDITDRKLAEQEILKARELAENSMKVREIFLANISHEIRTPMNAILGFTQLLYETNLSKDQKSFIDAIHFSGENLLVIINDILDFSKIQSGKIVFEKIEFNLNELLTGVITIFKQKAQEKGLKLTYQISRDVPNVVKGDPVRLNQVLTNLIGNAIKFTGKGAIDLDVQSIRSADENFSIQFRVTDTGIGVPEDKQSSIFESFVQASSETTRKYGGTGLGLTIVKNIVQLQGGTISLNSEPGIGSSFIVKLPFEKADHEIVQPKSPEIADAEALHLLRGASILVVEDNELNQLLVKRALDKVGCRTDVVSNGIHAISNLKVEKYDVVLMDIQMPDMDGYETTRYIRMNFLSPLSEIPIIAMTAHAFASEAEKCMAAGMTDYISKPFKQDVLFSKIIKCLHKAEHPKIVHFHHPVKVPQFIVDQNPIYVLGDNDDEFANEIVDIYDKQTPEFAQKLRDALHSHDFKTIRFVCHQIQSSYGILGVRELERVTTEISAFFKRDNFEAEFGRLTTMVNMVIALISALSEEVKRNLRKTG